ncbi:hypothetical protein DYB28_000963 [Aphanomyces astaci]|uniref:3-beta hydroxysteroid dehydrogenase/isomerase domain-containing protein n=1 Tax=Aphanomyces astaci TaxID=112090 RepID=A0A397D873_APHAT|nr:hypothetical protein DYB34_009086 [Aphanomyces astaci]RHY60554.1 hypothetical protein DYB38_008948 [Aphanomyces astaci]RHZ38150.1 hypothetical protein DYB26_005417 [Aphanomyces astaci]RLO09311.1 hypothetical protein DYB28_000963 [Aphanomyces astaci]
MVVGPSPFLSPLQRQVAETGSFPPVPKVCVVTGGTGFVGQRVVEMLVERGAEKVVSFDIVPKTADGHWDHPAIKYVVGDIADKDAVFAAVQGADCVFHLAAAVGPFHPRELYLRVNYHGTLNVIDACKFHNVSKLVMSSSPSTRFDGSDIDGLTEAELPSLPMTSYMQEYAETKAMAEMAITAANSPTLLTVSIAPHQVYGPRDNLFTPNILEAAGNGSLRVFSSKHTGYGYNKVCFTHVDNYAHALIIGERALYPGSPALGKFYVATDGHTHTFPEGYSYFWKTVDEAVVAMGFPSLWEKAMLPSWLLWPAAYVSEAVGWLVGRKLKLNKFTVRVLMMHRWFKIDAATKDLNFEPIVPFSTGWLDAHAWFRTHWLPTFQANYGLGYIANQSQNKIDVQAATLDAKSA